MPTGYPGTGKYSKYKNATPEQIAEIKRSIGRNRQGTNGKSWAGNMVEQIQRPEIALASDQPHHDTPRALLTVETIQSHTTALNMTNGTTIGQVVDGYISSLRAAGVKVRTITLSLPED